MEPRSEKKGHKNSKQKPKSKYEPPLIRDLASSILDGQQNSNQSTGNEDNSDGTRGICLQGGAPSAGNCDFGLAPSIGGCNPGSLVIDVCLTGSVAAQGG